MRRYSVIVVSAAACVALAACGKKTSEEPVMPAAPPITTTSEAPPASATPEELAAVSALPAPYNTGDPVAGEAKTAQCKSCHAFTKGGPNLTGPDLYGVFGTKAAEVPGFDFSDAMKASGLTWDAPTLDKWLTDPQALVPNTKMTFLGVKDAKSRHDIVAYIATQRDD